MSERASGPPPGLEAAARYGGERVLVLGAAGFLGRWVARSLARAGATLALAVRDEEEAEHVFERWDVVGRFLRRDLSQPGSVAELVEEIRPEVVFNLAGYGVDHGEREDALYQRINADLVTELAGSLGALHRGSLQRPGLPRLIHVGSALEYGVVTGSLDEAGPAEPTTVYGQTKLAGTRALTSPEGGRELPSVTARLFTVYGPGEHAGRLLPSLLAARDTEGPLSLTSGEQHRDFTYVEDAAEGLLRLGATTGPPAEVLNLATGALTRVREFVEIAARELGLPHDRLRFGALETRSAEQQHAPVTLARLRRRTGWAPGTTIEEGVRRTLAFERDRRRRVAPPHDAP